MTNRYYGDDMKTESSLAGTAIGRPRSMTIVEVLKDQLGTHQREAERIKKLLELLARNPDVDEIMNLSRGLV